MTIWGVRKTVGAVAVAAAVAGVGGAAIAAATETGYHAASGGFGGFSGFGGSGGPGGPPRSAHHGDLEPEPLHGENVVADGHGRFSTVLSQTGKITALSATSVTARSDDGFTQTYAIRAAAGTGMPPFAVNDAITIRATREGKTAMVSTMGPPLTSGH